MSIELNYDRGWFIQKIIDEAHNSANNANTN